MGAKDQNSTVSPNTKVVGEIDTSAPFQSVKDAVNLFGEGAFSGEKSSIKRSKPHSTEVAFLFFSYIYRVQLSSDLCSLPNRLFDVTVPYS